jgi:MFS family permease
VRLGYGVALPEMIRTLDSAVRHRLHYNAYLLSYICVSPLTGYLTDRLGGRRVITASLMLVGCGAFLLGTADKLWTACIFFGMAGLGSTGIWVPIITSTQRWFAVRRRGLALGVLSAGYGLGFAVVGVAFPWIVENFSWRYAWYILGVMAFCVVGPNGFVGSDPADCGLAVGGAAQLRSRRAGCRKDTLAADPGKETSG